MVFSIVASRPGSVEVLVSHEGDLPEPSAGTVRVRHTAIGVNYLDVYYRSGSYPWPVPSDLILGSEAAGVVEALGPDVTELAVGDRVAYTIANGAYTSHRNVPISALVKIPDAISDEVAAASMLKGLTAYYLLHRSYKVKAGDTVLFHAAAGGVGSIAGQWLAAKGARVIGTAGGAEKCEFARAHGYAAVIDYASEDFAESVLGLTSGEGVQVVYDSVGATTYRGSLRCLRRFGTLVCFGQSSGPITEGRIADLAAGSYVVTRPILYHFTADRAFLDQASAALFEAITSGAISVPIGQRFPLSEVGDAHAALEARMTTGSTILLP